MKQLGITRSAEELVEISSEAARQGIRVVALPLFGYQPVDFTVTSEELREINWLCFTSARGVERFFHVLKERHLTIAPETQFAVVGHKTAGALNARGFYVDLQPQEAESETLFAELLERVTPGETVVYVSADIVRFDPQDLFTKANQRHPKYRRLIVYRTEPLELDRTSINMFGANDSILFTSPHAALRFSQLYGEPSAHVLAIGNATAKAIAGLEWSALQTLPEPDVWLALELCQRQPAY